MQSLGMYPHLCYVLTPSVRLPLYPFLASFAHVKRCVVCITGAGRSRRHGGTAAASRRGVTHETSDVHASGLFLGHGRHVGVCSDPPFRQDQNPIISISIEARQIELLS